MTVFKYQPVSSVKALNGLLINLIQPGKVIKIMTIIIHSSSPACTECTCKICSLKSIYLFLGRPSPRAWMKLSFSSHAFYVSEPNVWNAVDSTACDSHTFSAFKYILKQISSSLPSTLPHTESLKCALILFGLWRYINCLLTYNNYNLPSVL